MKEQARDSHGRWTTSGMSERLAGLVENEIDSLVFNEENKKSGRYKHGDKDTLLTALTKVIGDNNTDGEIRQKDRSEARRVFRQMSKE